MSHEPVLALVSSSPPPGIRLILISSVAISQITINLLSSRAANDPLVLKADGSDGSFAALLSRLLPLWFIF